MIISRVKCYIENVESRYKQRVWGERRWTKRWGSGGDGRIKAHVLIKRIGFHIELHVHVLAQ